MKQSSRKVSSVLAAASLASGLLWVSGEVPASAATAKCRPLESAIGQTAKVCFASYGEVLTVYDTARDGKSAAANLSYSGQSGGGFYWNSNGAGTKKTFNLSIKDGTKVKIRVCRGPYKNYAKTTCNSWWTYKA
ncbi:hypothetical protein [Streptomyces mutabilis]|uniref:hypothetical protein n=1 Tax=Streptomyces mutabilis TaxID=67332 RepID=UPI0034DF6932